MQCASYIFTTDFWKTAKWQNRFNGPYQDNNVWSKVSNVAEKILAVIHSPLRFSVQCCTSVAHIDNRVQLKGSAVVAQRGEASSIVCRVLLLVETTQGKCRIVLCLMKWKLRERRSVSAVWRRPAFSRRAAAQPDSEHCDSD